MSTDVWSALSEARERLGMSNDETPPEESLAFNKGFVRGWAACQRSTKEEA